MRAIVALLIVGMSLASAWWLGQRTGRQIDRPPQFEVASSAPPLVAHTLARDAGQRAQESPLPAVHPLSEALCSPNMAWVQGEYCPIATAAGSCPVAARPIGVCMDVYEYPNQEGVYPAVMLDAPTAERICDQEGKRLCRDSEWTLACRSTLHATACNFGQLDKLVRVERLHEADHVSSEIALHDGRRRSQQTGCVNSSRIFDLLGNVQEWVQSEHPAPFVGAVKGGRYNQSSISCERTIYIKDPWTRYPHTGVRCCADPLVEMPGPK